MIYTVGKTPDLRQIMIERNFAVCVILISSASLPPVTLLAVLCRIYVRKTATICIFMLTAFYIPLRSDIRVRSRHNVHK